MRYRIKTREEIEKEYESIEEVKAGWDHEMEYLLGMSLTEEQYQIACDREYHSNQNYLRIDGWAVSLDMIYVEPQVLLNSYLTFKKMFGYVQI